MPTWVTTQMIKYAGIVAAILMLLLGVYMKGRHDVQVNFDEYKAKEQLVVQATTTVQKQVTKESSNVYKASLAAVNNYYSSGLRYDGTGTFSEATRGINGIPTYPVFVKQCAQTTLQLVSLQQWIKEEANATEEISK